MNWLTSLRDQLPLLLVLSPMIGFIVTWATSRFEPKLIRHLAVSNMLCTLVILCSQEWQFESDLASEADVIRLVQHQLKQSVNETESLVDVRRTLDRMRTERLRHQWFAVDGINLFSVLLVVVLTIVVVWRTDSSLDQDRWLIPNLLLFEAAALGALTAYDLRAFLFMTTASSMIMSVCIGRGGSSARRNHSERFLLAQFCGGAFITLGFSMLVIAVPWMKMPDSTTTPSISWNIASLTADIQKWMSRNELAFHYASEFFPWMLLILSLGFAIQSGLFPFHASQIRIVSDSSTAIAVLYLTGSLSAGRIAWLRFVMPLAPDLLVSFDRWLLIPSLVGAVWGALCAIAHVQPRQRVAFIFLSLSEIAFLGCYTFTRVGVCGAWLMHQQLTVFACTFLIAIDSRSLPTNDRQRALPNPSGTSFSTRSLILLICPPILGIFSSGYLIVSGLLFESLLLVAVVFVIGLINAATILSMLSQRDSIELQDGSQSGKWNSMSGPLIVSALFAVVASVFPGLLLHQCEAEIARVFRRFEYSQTAVSAETPSIEPHEEP